jgi:hypothetical protein
MRKKKKQMVFRVTVLALVWALAACPADTEDDAPAVIGGGDLTEIVPLPRTGETRQTALEQPEFTGSFEWQASYGGVFEAAPGSTFAVGMAYKAVITLRAKNGHTFKGTTADSFTHQKAVLVQEGGGAMQL